MGTLSYTAVRANLSKTMEKVCADHAKFVHPIKPGHVVVPHPRKDLAIGTLRNIYKQAGWDW